MAIQSNFPAIKPSLLLDFANTKQLDPRVTFSRASTATFYNGVTTAMAEQNLFTYSQTFSNAVWTSSLSGATFSTTTATAPDTTSTAATLLASSGSSGHATAWTYTSYAAGTYTLSFFIQAGTSNFASIYFSTGSLSNAICTVNLSTGAVTQTGSNSSITYVSSSITLVSGTWYRVSLTATLSTTLSLVAGIQINNSATPTYVNGGPQIWTAAGTESVSIWGAQLEQRSAVTAYTATTTQAITNYIPVLQTAASGVPRFDCNPTTGESLGLLIEESRTNLLIYSAQFDNAAWTKGGSTITADTIVSPDGTLNGDKLVEDTSTGDHRIYQQTSFTSGTAYAFTVYAKAAGRTLLQLFNSGSIALNVTFDLSNGTITNTSSGTGAITSVGNGWYRCSVSATASATAVSNNQIRLVNTGTNTSYTGDGWSGVYLWGAQLEVGAFATSYIPTVASTVTRQADSASMTGTNFSSWYNQAQGTIYVDYVGNANNPSANNQGIYAFGPGGYIGTNSNIAIINAGGMNIVANLSGTYTSLFAYPRVVAGRLASSYSPTTLSNVVNNGIVATASISPTLGGVTSVNFGTTPNPIPVLNGSIKKFAYYPIAVTSAQLQALTS